MKIWANALLVLSLLTAALTLAGQEPDLKRYVRSRHDGCCYIDRIPQVSQKKSFCVPATVSMVLRYYDANISQKKLAKLFETGKDGTDPNMILAKLNDEQFSDFTPKRIYALTTDEYEKAVNAALDHPEMKRKNRKKLDKLFPGGDPREVLYLIPPEVALKAMPAARTPCAEAIKAGLKEYINAGIPILWSVFMGFDPEERCAEGHMRLIVGYWEKAGEITRIIYRDSWGRRADKKEMDFDNAVIMTMGMYVIIPSAVAPAD